MGCFGTMAQESNYSQELSNVLKGTIDCITTRETVEQAFHLIMAGADPNTQCKLHQHTILIQVIHLGDLHLFKKFVKEAKCSTNIEDSNQRKPIDYAIAALCPKIVEWLLDNGSDANEIVSSDKGKCKRLHVLSDYILNSAADVENAIAIAKLLINKGANVVEMDERGWLPMQLAERNRPCGEFTNFLKEETQKIRNKLNEETWCEKLKIAEASDTDLELMAENKEIKKKLSYLEEETKAIWKRLNSVDKEVAFEVIPTNQQLKRKLTDMEERFKKMEEQIRKLKNREGDKNHDYDMTKGL